MYDGTRERSALARRRATDLLAQYRDEQLRAAALQRGITPVQWSAFLVEERNTATSREQGAFLLGLLLPILFVVMVALGCLHPAIDATAGERERGTWETLMSTAASRTSIVIAKYLSVTTLGGLAGLLNVVAMLLTMRGVVAPLLGKNEAPMEFAVAPGVVPLLILSAVLLAGLLAAGMMLLAAFARTFREGQTMVTPFYLAAVLPTMFLSSPGSHLTAATALVPVVSLALVVREALGGVVRPLETFIAVIASLAAIALLLRLAALVLGVENVVIGSYGGSLMSFLKGRHWRTAGNRAAAP